MTPTPTAILHEIIELGERATEGPLVFTVRHGGDLTGVDAEIAEMQDCEPFAYSEAKALNGDLSLIWDSREDGATEKALALCEFIAAARKADALAAELIAAREAIARLIDPCGGEEDDIRVARRLLPAEPAGSE